MLKASMGWAMLLAKLMAAPVGMLFLRRLGLTGWLFTVVAVEISLLVFLILLFSPLPLKHQPLSGPGGLEE